ncbi:HCP-like protein [Gigaspora margarita]|uniref:HCP-like protein n=1 Tax=Gigaspora margarita TaxID=4874 RepID=A0A8H3X1L4_GIGMA|nr:HCP-like protein [Gigaspora margarita]
MEHLCEDMFFVALKDYQCEKYETSFEKFEKAAYKYKANSRYEVYAKYYLALHYKLGKPIKNDKKAYELFNEVIHAQIAQSNSRYNDDAKYMLAKCYESGQGVGKDCKRAFDIYLDLLGDKSHYENSNKKYYNKELEDDVKFKLANCYSNGQGVAKNDNKAYQLYLDLSKSKKYQINAFK